MNPVIHIHCTCITLNIYITIIKHQGWNAGGAQQAIVLFLVQYCLWTKMRSLSYFYSSALSLNPLPKQFYIIVLLTGCFCIGPGIDSMSAVLPQGPQGRGPIQLIENLYGGQYRNNQLITPLLNNSAYVVYTTNIRPAKLVLYLAAEPLPFMVLFFSFSFLADLWSAKKKRNIKGYGSAASSILTLSFSHGI